MRKAILEKFIFVLLAALCINSVIFYIASRNTILDTTKKDMLYTMEILDQTLDYEGEGLYLLVSEAKMQALLLPFHLPLPDYTLPLQAEQSAVLHYFLLDCLNGYKQTLRNPQ